MMSEDRMSNKGTRSAEDAVFQAEIDEEIARMRQMLKLMGPGTGAAALGAIRKAFPDVPLRKRVQALKTYR
jgi:hypothetical protein